MASSGSMRQVHSKNVGYKIEQMRWSNRMDLLVISNDKGEIIVHRLNLQKIWTHPPPGECARVRALDWRPDEKIIAVGYSTGLVALLDIENQHVLHSFELDSDISCLSWTRNNREIVDDGDHENPLDLPETYLPPLPSFNSLTSNAPKTDYNATDSYSKKVINMLVVGLRSGFVHMSVFGVLPCGRINVLEHLKKNNPDLVGAVEIIDAKMSADFRQLQILVIVGGSRLDLVTFDNEMLPNYLWPLLQLATKHGYILNTMAYIEDIIQCITEAWETALLEMDNKLTKYATGNPARSVSADFLELLVFGFPSDSLEEFLTRDLTEKGLKKLGCSIEISYATIQKLVIKPLHSGILNICYHLGVLKGMSRNTYYYKPLLGSPTNTCMQSAGAFLIKSLELQQTIEQSTRDYKIFWCWLYGVVIRLMEEVVPDDIAAVSQQDYVYLAEFLNNFDTDPDEPPMADASVQTDSTSMNASNSTTTSKAPTRKRFNLERVGQYLQDQPLLFTQNADLTQKWDQLLEENECLKECDIVYPYDRNLSLVQQHKILKRGIDEIFSKPEQMIGKQFGHQSYTECTRFDPGTFHLRTTHVNNTTIGFSMFATMSGYRELILVEIVGGSRRAIRFEFQNRLHFDEKYAAFGSLEFRDIEFYNENTLSMLLFNNTTTVASSSTRSSSSPDNRSGGNGIGTNCFVQFPIAAARPLMVHTNDLNQVPTVNMYEALDAQLIRPLDGTDAAVISVSGSRKVSALLAESQKRLRVFEMEVDEDDDDLLDMSQSSVGLDMSQTSVGLDASRDSTQSS